MACGVQDGGMFEAELTCPVCLDVYRDPHQLPCGHNFCLLCLNQLKRRGQVCCPECRKSYSASTHWQKNFKLSNIAEEFRRHGSSPQSHLERPGLSGKAGGVRCDFCPPEGGTALKTCLKCEVSMCGEHLRPHLELQAFLEHPLVEPQNGLKKRKCEEHEEMFRYYCREDRSFLCNACTIEGGHSGHNVKTLKNTMKHFKVTHTQTHTLLFHIAHTHTNTHIIVSYYIHTHIIIVSHYSRITPPTHIQIKPHKSKKASNNCCCRNRNINVYTQKSKSKRIHFTWGLKHLLHYFIVKNKLVL